MRLGNLLLRRAAIGAAQLEAALRNQILFGGRLGTSLVELGYVELNDLGGFISEQTGRPLATPTMLGNSPADLLAKLGKEFAFAAGAIPLGTNQDGSVAVAFIDPLDAPVVESVAGRLRSAVVPFITPELRGLYYLEHHYGLPRDARYLRNGSRDEGPGVGGIERRRTQPAGGLVLPPKVTLEPRRKRISSNPPITPTEQTATTMAEVLQRLGTATHRDQLGLALTKYARGRTAVFVALLVRDGNALGWRGHIPHRRNAPFAALSLPLGGASALQIAHDSQKLFAGPLPTRPHPVEDALCAALNVPALTGEFVVAPVIVNKRVVNLLFAQPAGSATLAMEFIDELNQLAQKLSDAYVRLIRGVQP